MAWAPFYRAADHLAATGIRTFIVGMTGATLGNLETLAVAGGAEPHAEWCGTGPGAAGDMCHYFNVGNGDPAAFVQALQDIQEATVIPCE